MSQMLSFPFLLAIIVTILYATCVSCTYEYDHSPKLNEEAPYVRNYFYVGGTYVPDGSGGHAFQDQMYVEKLTPLGGAKKQTPLVFIPGAGQTGTVYFYFTARIFQKANKSVHRTS
jgi:hypothetical protein